MIDIKLKKGLKSAPLLVHTLAELLQTGPASRLEP